MARPQVKKTQVSRQKKASTQTRSPMKEQSNEVVFAMDIGTRSIIGMVGIVQDGRVNIIAVEREEHAQRAMIDGQIENIEKVSGLAGKVKKRLEAKTRIKLSRVCVAAAGRALRTKRADYEMELPGTQLIDDEIISRLEAGAITRAEEAFDAENESSEEDRRFYLVGYTVCQYFLDKYTISNLKDHRGRQIKVDLIATFLPSEVVESLYTTMNKIGLEVASLTLEPIAAINAAIPENIRLLNLVLVDIGAGTSDIAACTNGSITGYTMATMAGDEITEAIMKQYLVDFSTAEAMKAQLDHEEEIRFSNILGMEQTLSRAEVETCIRGTLEALSKEIADKVVEINSAAPSALFLAGGGSKLAGLKDGITEALGMDASRVAVAGNYFQSNAFSEEYELNNPEYATPLGIAVSSGLNMINDSFRVTLNGRPAKLFRSGTFTALNLLMMNGYNFRDIVGRAGMNLAVTVNGRRKVFYGAASEPASLLINQKEGKLSDVIHAGDFIDFVPATQGADAKACLGDIDGVTMDADVTVNGMRAPLRTPLKSGDVILLKREETETDSHKAETVKPEAAQTEGDDGRDEAPEAAPGEAGQKTAETGSAGQEFHEAVEPESAGQETYEAVEPESAGQRPYEASEPESAGQEFHEAAKTETVVQPEMPTVTDPVRLSKPEDEMTPAEAVEELPQAFREDAASQEELAAGETAVSGREMIWFQLNENILRLPRKEDGRPYYLMDLIEYSGIDLEHPKGVVTFSVNGEDGRFQQVLREGDVINIVEMQR